MGHRSHRNEWRTVGGPHALVFLEANQPRQSLVDPGINQGFEPDYGFETGRRARRPEWIAAPRIPRTVQGALSNAAGGRGRRLHDFRQAWTGDIDAWPYARAAANSFAPIAPTAQPARAQLSRE